MQSKLINQKTKLIKINAELHRLLKIKAASEKRAMKEMLEEWLYDILWSQRKDIEDYV